jgi:hypothetical protein
VSLSYLNFKHFCTVIYKCQSPLYEVHIRFVPMNDTVHLVDNKRAQKSNVNFS